VVELLYIVAKDRPDLAATLGRDFRGEDAVRIVVDRRAAERRRQEPRGTADERRRGADRRRAAQDRRDLGILGYVRIVRSDA